MHAHVCRPDGGGPLWPEQVFVCTFPDGELAFFVPRGDGLVAVDDELVLRQAAGVETRVVVVHVRGGGTYVCLRRLP